MPNRTVYLKGETERGLEVIFNYLKSIGEIPTNAFDIGKYRAQCITFTINYTVGSITQQPNTQHNKAGK